MWRVPRAQNQSQIQKQEGQRHISTPSVKLHTPGTFACSGQICNHSYDCIFMKNFQDRTLLLTLSLATPAFLLPKSLFSSDFGVAISFLRSEQRSSVADTYNVDLMGYIHTVCSHIRVVRLPLQVPQSSICKNWMCRT